MESLIALALEILKGVQDITQALRDAATVALDAILVGARRGDADAETIIGMTAMVLSDLATIDSLRHYGMANFDSDLMTMITRAGANGHEGTIEDILENMRRGVPAAEAAKEAAREIKTQMEETLRIISGGRGDYEETLRNSTRQFALYDLPVFHAILEVLA